MSEMRSQMQEKAARTAATAFHCSNELGMSSDETRDEVQEAKPFDWSTLDPWSEKHEAEHRDKDRMNNPFPHIDKHGPTRIRTSRAKEFFEHYRERDERHARLYPKMMYWIKHQAYVGGQPFVWERAWPDWTEEWEGEKDPDGNLIGDGGSQALHDLYDRDAHFRASIDKDRVERQAEHKELNRGRNMALWHRLGWTVVWTQRLAGKKLWFQLRSTTGDNPLKRGIEETVARETAKHKWQK